MSSTTSNQCFQFFGLPREVRDLVYEYLTVGGPVQVAIWLIHLPHAFAYIEHAPRASILLANRQLHAEYCDRIEEYTSMRIVGPTTDGAIAALLTKVVRPFSETMERCSIYMPITCHDCRPRDDEEDSRGRAWVDDDSDAGSDVGGRPGFCGAYDLLSFYVILLATKFLPNFRNLHTVHLRIGIVLSEGQRECDFDWPKSPHSGEFVDELRKLVLLPVIESLDLVICREWSEYQDYCQSAGQDAPRMFAQWRKATGWVGGEQVKADIALKACDSVLFGLDNITQCSSSLSR